jgi:hypothetical protein
MANSFHSRSAWSSARRGDGFAESTRVFVMTNVDPLFGFDGRIDWRQTLFTPLVFLMPSAPRPAVLSTRASVETKAHFAALAARQGLSESALLALLIEQVVARNAGSTVLAAQEVPAGIESEGGRSNDRLTLRLRPGDRVLADARASARRMKTASYLSMLIHTHVRGAPVMPPAELDELKALTGHLGAIGRQLRALGERRALTSGNCFSQSSDALMGEVGELVDTVRESVAAVVRMNLISWEAGNA